MGGYIMSAVNVKPDTGSTFITIAAIAALGYFLYRKVDNLANVAAEGVTNVYQSYKTDITETYNNISETTSNLFPYVGIGDDNAPPVEVAFREMPKSDLDADFLKKTGYSATGYRDVSKIGMSPAVPSNAKDFNADVNRILSTSKANTNTRKLIASGLPAGGVPYSPVKVKELDVDSLKKAIKDGNFNIGG
jgi:hypothetical protein